MCVTMPAAPSDLSSSPLQKNRWLLAQLVASSAPSLEMNVTISAVATNNIAFPSGRRVPAAAASTVWLAQHAVIVV